MKRLVASLAIIATLGVLNMQPATAAPWRYKECRYQFVDGRAGWNPSEVKQTILCAGKRFGDDLGTAMYVANRESHLGQFATNVYSGACGIYQHIPRYWAGRLSAFIHARPKFAPIGTSCYNARSNILVSLWMARSSWSPWAL